MKFAQLIAAAGLAFAGIASATTPASAAPIASIATLAVDGQSYGYDRDRGDRYDRRDRYERRRYDDRRGYRRGYRPHRSCWTERRHHRRVTLCRRR